MLLLLAAGCGSTASGSANTTTTGQPQPRLELFLVDEALTRQAQAGSLNLKTLPPGKVCRYRLLRDNAGNVQRDFYGKPLRTFWILGSTPLLAGLEVARVSNPGTDAQGRPLVVIYYDEQGAAGLAALSGRLAEAGQSSGIPSRLAIVIDDEVKAVNAITVPLEDGELQIAGIPAREAMDIEAQFNRR